MEPPLILLTNDDGIEAEGIRALEAALPGNWEVHVVAPARPMSQCGHRITTYERLPVVSRGLRRHAVDGTPADCVRLALTHLLPRKPDWVFSGVNQGGNLGADIYVSGTVAAVREGAYLGVPGMAFSQYHRRGKAIDWAWTSRCVRGVMEALVDEQLGLGEHWNINLPHADEDAGVPGHVHCEPSRKSLPVSFKAVNEGDDAGWHYVYDGVYAEREREAGSDVDVCFGGKVAVSKLRLHG